MGRDGEALRTWGGRLYYCEEPKYIDGKLRTFEYKLLNYLIQGSSADCTKEAMIRFHETKDPETTILLNVHDELLCSTPREIERQELDKLREAMESVEFERKHARAEEREVLPLAMETFTPSDWSRIDAAFADNKDPLFGSEPEAWLVGIRGYAFDEFGERLSDGARENLEAAAALVRSGELLNQSKA